MQSRGLAAELCLWEELKPAGTGAPQLDSKLDLSHTQPGWSGLDVTLEGTLIQDGLIRSGPCVPDWSTIRTVSSGVWGSRAFVHEVESMHPWRN